MSNNKNHLPQNIRQKIAYLLGLKLKQVRERLNKSLDETAQSLGIKVEELEGYETGVLETRIRSSDLIKLFKDWNLTQKDIVFYQILNSQTAEEMFEFYQNQKDSGNQDYVDHIIEQNEELKEVKKVLNKKI